MILIMALGIISAPQSRKAISTYLKSKSKQ